jgi:serine/threonine-protein kinase
MGEVYRARDTRLDRLVAVKRLTAPHSARFQSEARAIAALNHPHICQLYDVGPDYLVMEFLEGETLAEGLGRSKDRLPLADDALQLHEALGIAIQVADAVATAHQHGILHRDLKPGNIMVVRRGGPSGPPAAKLLDFGLAKSMTTDADVTRTAAGTVIGTAAYMAPEQAEGKPADARSDVFSFGAVLYELLAGHRPFEGATSAQVLSAVLRDDPRPLRTTVPALERIVHRCLAKDPGQRLQTMAEVKAALEQIAAVQVSTQRAASQPSIAVLPFADMSAGKDQEWFSDGLAEEIINALAQISGLKVIARTSAFAFKGKNEDVRRIAETLGVAHILEGSVRRVGDRVRVTAQLIAATDGSHLWSERYDRDITDVFAIQDDIARTIALALKLKLSADRTVVERQTPSIAAYDAYLKARYHISKVTPESLARAREYLEQAIALDADFALAHVGLGGYFANLTLLGLQPSRQTFPLARASFLRALELDPALAEAQAALGMLAANDYDWREADRRFLNATAREPVPPIVSYHYGQYLAIRGRSDEGIEQLQRTIQGDPLFLPLQSVLANILQAAGRSEEAAIQYRRTLDLNEQFWPAHEGLATTQAFRGMLTEALASAERTHALAPWNPTGLGILGGLLRRLGEVGRSEALLRQLGDGERFGAPIGLALFYAMCMESDLGADWLEKAIEQRDPRVLVFQSLATGAVWRASSRWPALAKMLNLPETAS